MEKIIIDTDTGIDDSLAILLANYSKELDVQAITLVEGNCKLKYADDNVFKLLELSNSLSIPVYKGEAKPLQVKPIYADYVHGKNGMGNIQFSSIKQKIQKENAVDYLINSINKNPNEITIVAIGPLTNIAKAILKDKNFAKNIKQLIIMGGAEGPGNISPHAEFNFYRDPHAAKIVFEAEIKEVVMFGLDVTNKLPLLEKYEKLLLAINNETSNLLYKASRMGADFDRKEGGEGLIINDALTLAYLINNDIVKLKKANISIITDGEKRGKSVINYDDKPNGKIAYDVDVNKFYLILFTRIFYDYIPLINEYIIKK